MRRLRPTGWLLLAAAVILFVWSVYLTVVGSTMGFTWSWVAMLCVIVALEFYRRGSR